MAQVSKHSLSQSIYNKIFSLFPTFLSRLSKQNQEQIVIDTLFSSTERIMIAKRLAIAFMLVKGYTYQEIVSKLKVSWSTIGKISELIKNADPVFVKELEKIAKEDAFTDFLGSIGYQLDKLLPPKGGNWSGWRRRIEQERRQSKQPF